ncbi:MAG: hypothetical protein JWM47_3109 [Acidimicrobiales bacterium]|nr:hypothetical protein [Acidimicrobiales bacterium]
MKLQAHGIETDLPAGWEGRIALRATPTASGTATDPRARAKGTAGEVPHPVVHLANFPLPEDRGDFGSGAVDLMTEEDLLIVLFEYGPESVGTALFERTGIPDDLTPAMFSSSALQRTIAGQAGCQVFFTVAGRAFCCYTVLGRQAAALRLLPQANATLAATRISPR